MVRVPTLELSRLAVARLISVLADLLIAGLAAPVVGAAGKAAEDFLTVPQVL